MITYEGFRGLMMAEDDSRCCFGLFGPLFQPNILKLRQGAYFFIAASDGNAPGRRNTTQKSKNNEKLNSSETRFFQVWPNRPILRGSKVVCPRMVLTLFWTAFNGF